jgi:hypothetical protein
MGVWRAPSRTHRAKTKSRSPKSRVCRHPLLEDVTAERVAEPPVRHLRNVPLRREEIPNLSPVPPVIGEPESSRGVTIPGPGLALPPSLADDNQRTVSGLVYLVESDAVEHVWRSNVLPGLAIP